MRSLRRLPLRPSRMWLTAGVLLLSAAIWVITTSFGPRPADGLPQEEAPKAVATAPSVATPTPTPTPQPTSTARVAPGSATVVGIGDSVTSATVCGCTGFVESYAA